MEYCITMEQTRRIAVWFNADSDEAAEEKALEIYHNTPAKDFEAGDDTPGEYDDLPPWDEDEPGDGEPEE